MKLSTKKQIWVRVAAIFLLSAMLLITTYALAMPSVSVIDNLFDTGAVKIDLNHGEVVFDGSDINLEPGYRLKKEFTVTNEGTTPIYYRLYLENVEGELADALVFQIYDGDTLLYEGEAKYFNKENYCEGTTPLLVGETVTLTALVTMRSEVGNAFQGSGISFDMAAQAVQSKNNPNRIFE
jgi:hypothetical protein